MGEVASRALPGLVRPNQTLAVGYARVSTSEQTAGHSLETQRASIAEHCARQGWQLVGTHTDVQSGKSTRNRPELAGALELCRTGKTDVLVAAKLDRLSRSFLDFATLVDQAQHGGWSLVCVDQNFDLDTPQGRAMAGMLAVFAQLEREVIGQRVKDALQTAKRNGSILGRPELIDADTKAWIIRQRKQGRPLAKIADSLNRRHIPTAHGGQRWYPSTIRHVTRKQRDTTAPPATATAVATPKGVNGLVIEHGR